MAIPSTPVEYEQQVASVLSELLSLGDRFEYARTVCLALEDRGVHALAQLSDATASALHYFSSLGLTAWCDRLKRVAGHAIQISSFAATNASGSDLETTECSSAYQQTLVAARIASRSREPALILGETGCGKEVVARIIHESSSRSGRPLVAINCGAIPENLIESELFGHVRGAFTGADRDRVGLFEAAQGGTVLLDEVGDLPPQVQVKLLRFLDRYEFRRIGEHRLRTIDIRILAATHKDLSALVEAGAFRQDLYYRLKVFRIDVPPLRLRREDVLHLAHHFLAEEGSSTLPLQFTPELGRWLESYDWPGNIRELRNLCRYFCACCWGKSEVGIQDLPPDLKPLGDRSLERFSLNDYEREKQSLERLQIQRALARTGGSISDASRVLNLGRNYVARKIKQYGISRELYRK
jgi:DNA-binding NtrC family response regulator